MAMSETDFDVFCSYNTHSSVDKLGRSNPIDFHTIIFSPSYEFSVFLARIERGRHGVGRQGSIGSMVED
jgi:hypothetical protein